MGPAESAAAAGQRLLHTVLRVSEPCSPSHCNARRSDVERVHLELDFEELRGKRKVACEIQSVQQAVGEC